MQRDEFPEELVKHLPQSYINLLTILLGRLAVTKTESGKGYAAYVLVDALNRRSDLSDRLGTLAVMVNPIDKKAQSFYTKYGFINLP